MQRDDTYLLDILESARLARQYVDGLDRESFMRDSQVQDNVPNLIAGDVAGVLAEL